MKKLLALILVFILTLSNLLTYDSYGNQIIENEYNYSGGSGISGDPYVIKTSEDLQNISHNLTSSFIQDNNIDLSGIENWSPIGSSSTEPFIGIYDGNGYSIKNLKITSGSKNIGLFGYVSNEGLIKNVNLIEPIISINTVSSKFIGSLVGYSNGGSIVSCSSINGSITGGYALGGLVGVSKSNLISKSYFIGSVLCKNKATGIVGGLVGYTNIIDGSTKPTIIEECFADSITTGGQFTGGLVGDNTGTVKNSFSSGIVSGSNNTGGLIGISRPLEHDNSNIINCYTTASVDNNEDLPYGGLIGNYKDNDDLILSSFWDADLFESYPQDDNFGISTSSIQDENTLVSLGWNFDNIWSVDDIINNGYPYLVHLPKQKLTISGDFSVEDKKYEGSREASFNSNDLILSGNYIPSHSDITFNPVATFNDNTIGNDKVVDLRNSYFIGKDAFLYEIDFTNSPTTSANIYDYANYTIAYYVEPLDEGEYYIHSTSTGCGLVEKTITTSAIEIDGFTFNEEASITSGTIDAGGSLELNLYYNRNVYSVTFEDFDGSIIEAQQVKYGGDAVLLTNPYRSGYRFQGWSGNYVNIKNNEIITPLYKKKTKPQKIEKVKKIEVPSVENHWSEEAVEELVNKGIIINYTNFNPDKDITRVEFADYITRALGILKEDNTYKTYFRDVKENDEYSDSIKSALEKGIIKGYKDGTFRPYRTITRQEAMVMYSRAMDILNIDFYEFKPLGIYDDYSKLDDWSLLDVRKVITAGIFKGTEENILSPSSTFKYSEAAESIRNLLYIK